MQSIRLPVRKEVSVFVPGPDVERDRKALRKLEEEGAVLVLAENLDDLACGARPGNGTLFAPRQRALYEAALAHATRVVTERPGLSELAERLREKTLDVSFAASTEVFAFCCVADSQYLPFFFALFENLKHLHRGPLEVHLLAVDDGVAPAVRAQYPGESIRIYPLQEIWEPEEWDRISKRPVSLQALSSKPRIFLRARQNSTAPAVFLLDLDMYFYRSPVHLNSAFGNDHTLFFPQWSDRFTWTRLHGLFNSGMVGAKKGAENLIAWWSQACWNSCELEVETGRFGDQAFIDQAILYFEGIRIYRGFDEDVAPWNCQTLDVTWNDSRLQVLGTKPVGSFHAAGPDGQGIFEEKHAWDQLVSVFSVVSDPDRVGPLLRNTLEQQRCHWPKLDRALRLRHLAKARTPLPVADITADWVRRAVSPWGSACLGVIDSVHRKYREIKGNPNVVPMANQEYDFWVQLQKKALFAPEKLIP